MQIHNTYGEWNRQNSDGMPRDYELETIELTRAENWELNKKLLSEKMHQKDKCMELLESRIEVRAERKILSGLFT